MRKSGTLVVLVTCTLLVLFVAIFLTQQAKAPKRTGAASTALATQPVLPEIPTGAPMAPTVETVGPTPIEESPLPTPSAVPTLSPHLLAYQFTLNPVPVAVGYPAAIGKWLPDADSVSLIAPLFEPSREGGTAVRSLDLSSLASTDYGYVFGTRRFRQPVWLEESGQFAFVGAASIPDLDPSTFSFVTPLQSDLWITGPDTTGLETPALQDVVAIAGRGRYVLALQRSPRQLVKIDTMSGEQSVVPVDLSAFDNQVSPAGGEDSDAYLQMIWHPTNSVVVIFNSQAIGLIDVDQSAIRLLDLGESASESAGYGPRWAYNAEWNPKNTQIAMNVVVGDPLFNGSELFLLETTTGSINIIELPYGYISDMEWSPNGSVLLVRQKDPHSQLRVFFLVDGLLWDVVRISSISDAPFVGSDGFDLAWSPDGTKVLALEPEGILELNVTHATEGGSQ